MPLMHSFSWHGPFTDTLTGYAERYLMPSSPNLQPQRGAGVKSVVDETVDDEIVVGKLVDETAVEDEAIACDVVTPGDDADISCDVQLPVHIVVGSSTDSGSTEISDKTRFGNRREFSFVGRVLEGSGRGRLDST